MAEYAVLIGAAITAVVGTYTAVSTAQNASAAADVQSQMQQQEADSARQAAAYKEQQYRRRLTLALGKEEAVGAASGVDPFSGSPLFMELDNIKQGELEALNIRHAGTLTASARTFESSMNRFKSSTLAGQAGFAGAGAALSGASSVLSNWAKYNKNTGNV